MSAARFFAAFAAFAVCALHGAVRRSESSGRLAHTEGLLSDVRRIGPLIGSLRMPLEAVCRRLAEQGEERELWERIAGQMSRGRSFSQACGGASAAKLPPKAGAVLKRLSVSLGGGDAQTAVSAVEQAADELSRIASDERSSAARRSRLEGSLSMLFGLGLALLIL